MSTVLIIFCVLSAITLSTAFLTIFSRNPIHSAIYLVICFFSIAGHYLLLNAQFLAVVHIVVYSGAIMVLFLFVIMLMNLNEDTEPQRTWLNKIIAAVAGGMLLFVMVGSLKGADQLQSKQWGSSQIGLIKNLGMVLFKEFLFPFEIASILLLAAMVGAIMIGKKEIK